MSRHGFVDVAPNEASEEKAAHGPSEQDTIVNINSGKRIVVRKESIEEEKKSVKEAIEERRKR